MCFSVENKVQIAKKDIVCYKYITSNGKSMHFPLRVGRKVESWKVGFHYTEARFPKTLMAGRSIAGSAFHSFKTITALKEYYNFNVYSCTDYKVIRCIIPKGASYYVNSTQYCSSDIIYQEDYKPETRKKCLNQEN